MVLFTWVLVPRPEHIARLDELIGRKDAEAIPICSSDPFSPICIAGLVVLKWGSWNGSREDEMCGHALADCTKRETLYRHQKQTFCFEKVNIITFLYSYKSWGRLLKINLVAYGSSLAPSFTSWYVVITHYSSNFTQFIPVLQLHSINLMI